MLHLLDRYLASLAALLFLSSLPQLYAADVDRAKETYHDMVFCWKQGHVAQQPRLDELLGPMDGVKRIPLGLECERLEYTGTVKRQTKVEQRLREVFIHSQPSHGILVPNAPLTLMARNTSDTISILPPSIPTHVDPMAFPHLVMPTKLINPEPFAANSFESLIDIKPGNVHDVVVGVMDSSFNLEAIETANGEMPAPISYRSFDPLPPTISHGLNVSYQIFAAMNGYEGLGSCSSCLWSHYGLMSADPRSSLTQMRDVEVVLSRFIEAANAAIEDRIDVLNLSLGSPLVNSAIRQVILRLLNNGVVIVAAAGNDGLDETLYPASETAVIAAAATDTDGLIWQQSNRGDVAAPLYVYSPFKNASQYVAHPPPLDPSEGWSIPVGYGTSYSAPQITGLAAGILDEMKSLSNYFGFLPANQYSQYVEHIMRTTAQPVAGAFGYRAGAGVIDMPAAIRAVRGEAESDQFAGLGIQINEWRPTLQPNEQKLGPFLDYIHARMDTPAQTHVEYDISAHSGNCFAGYDVKSADLNIVTTRHSFDIYPQNNSMIEAHGTFDIQLRGKIRVKVRNPLLPCIGWISTSIGFVIESSPTLTEFVYRGELKGDHYRTDSIELNHPARRIRLFWNGNQIPTAIVDLFDHYVDQLEGAGRLLLEGMDERLIAMTQSVLNASLQGRPDLRFFTRRVATEENPRPLRPTAFHPASRFRHDGSMNFTDSLYPVRMPELAYVNGVQPVTSASAQPPAPSVPTKHLGLAADLMLLSAEQEVIRANDGYRLKDAQIRTRTSLSYEPIDIHTSLTMAGPASFEALDPSTGYWAQAVFYGLLNMTVDNQALGQTLAILRVPLASNDMSNLEEWRRFDVGNKLLRAVYEQRVQADLRAMSVEIPDTQFLAPVDIILTMSDAIHVVKYLYGSPLARRLNVMQLGHAVYGEMNAGRNWGGLPQGVYANVPQFTVVSNRAWDFNLGLVRPVSNLSDNARLNATQVRRDVELQLRGDVFGLPTTQHGTSELFFSDHPIQGAGPSMYLEVKINPAAGDESIQVRSNVNGAYFSPYRSTYDQPVEIVIASEAYQLELLEQLYPADTVIVFQPKVSDEEVAPMTIYGMGTYYGSRNEQKLCYPVWSIVLDHADSAVEPRLIEKSFAQNHRFTNVYKRSDIFEPIEPQLCGVVTGPVPQPFPPHSTNTQGAVGEID